MGARSGNDLIWSKEFLGELLGGSCRTEELCLDKCVTTNFEFWSQKTAGVSRRLVLTLSMGRSEITFQVNCEVQVIALIGKEGCDSSSSTGCIIIGKLS